MTDKLTIAIDYDDTFSADMKAWTEVIAVLQSAGHRVIMVTARRDTDENREGIKSWLDHFGVEGVPLYFTNLGSKLHWAESRGLKVNIWIDDDPRSLVHGR